MRRFALFLAAGALIALAVTSRAVVAASPAPPGCTADVAHQFDFWVGDWNVYDPHGVLEGTNRVTLEYGTCVVHEHWKGVGGDEGESVNFYYRPTKKWHQTWVSNGGYLLLDGGMVGNAMVLSGAHKTGAGTRIDRISYAPAADGSVRQVWDVSTDGGKTWKTTFDGKYVKKS